MNTFKTLVRREYWEHKSLFWVPIVLCTLMILGSLIALFVPSRLQNELNLKSDARITLHEGNNHFHLESDDLSLSSLARLFESLPESTQGVAINGMLHGVIATVMPIALFLTFAMALQVLYRERKDRSVLFWRSLPTSDTATVLSKLFYLAIVFPLFCMVMIALTQIVLLLIFSLAGLFQGMNILDHIWGPAELLLAWWDMLGTWFILLFWYLPILGYMMMMSAVARSQPILYALLTPALIILVEKFFLGSTSFLHWLGEFFLSGFKLLQDSGMQMTGKSMTIRYGTAWGELFSLPILLGLLVATGFLVVAIQARRRSEIL